MSKLRQGLKDISKTTSRRRDKTPPPRRRFPQLKKTRAAAPRLRLLAFPNSGSSENVYTGVDKLNGREDNVLMTWARKTGVEVWAAQPPGRDARLKETALTSCRQKYAKRLS